MSQVEAYGTRDRSEARPATLRFDSAVSERAFDVADQLSIERAQSIADVLVDLGVDSQRITVQGFGEAYPVADNASTRGRAQNRRVEIVFSDQNGQMGPSR